MKPDEYNQLSVFERALLEELRKLRSNLDDLCKAIEKV